MVSFHNKAYYDPVAEFYSRPQVGHGITIYKGNKKQTGGGMFATISRFAIPIMRRIKEVFVPKLKTAALEVAKNTLADVVSGKRVGDAIKSNVAAKVQRVLEQHDIDMDPTPQRGSGYKHKKKRRSKHKTATKRKATIKRANKIVKRAKKTLNKKKVFRDIFASR